MAFLIESGLILSGLTAVIVGLCRNKVGLAAVGGLVVGCTFIGAAILYQM